MKKIVLGSLAGLSLAVIATAAWWRRYRPPVRDAVPFDFGRLEAKKGSAEGRHTFTIRNDGDREVTIKRTSVSCGCVTLTAPKTIPAHGEAKIEARIKLPANALDRRTVRALVDTDEPDRNRYTYYLTAAVAPSLLVTSTVLDFGDVYTRMPSTKEFNALLADAKRIEPLVAKAWVEGTNEVKVALVSRPSVPSAEGDLTVNVSSMRCVLTARSASAPEQALLRFEGFDGKAFSVPIRWRARAMPLFDPATLYVESKPAGSGTYKVTYTGAGPGDIRRVSFDSDALKPGDCYALGRAVCICMRREGPAPAARATRMHVELLNGTVHDLPIVFE